MLYEGKEKGLELIFVFKIGVGIEEGDVAIDEIEGMFIANEEVKTSDKERRRSSFEGDMCTFRNRMRTEINEIYSDFKFESEI